MEEEESGVSKCDEARDGSRDPRTQDAIGMGAR